MTIEALLHVLLVAAVPGLMAGIGVHLAVKSLESRRQKIGYLAGFSFLLAIGIVVAIWQQITVTAAQKKTADEQREAQTKVAKEQHDADLRHEGSLQYLKGEVSLLTTILANQQLSSKPAEPKATIKPSYAATRESLADFIQQGETLKMRCLREPKAPLGDANQWATKVHEYLLANANLDKSYDVRFLNPPTPLPIEHAGVPPENDILWRNIAVRVDVLRGFIGELRD